MSIARALNKFRPDSFPFSIAAATAMMMLAIFAPLAAQDVIENPDKPLAKDAGRVLKFRDEWVITDEGGDFYFKGPNHLQVADDGSVFVADEKQLLRFSPDGRFLKNIFKSGQGPGEIGSWFSYLPAGGSLFIRDGQSSRFWRADPDGALKESIPLEKSKYNDFIAVVPGGFLFLRKPGRTPRNGQESCLRSRIRSRSSTAGAKLSATSSPSVTGIFSPTTQEDPGSRTY